MSLATLDLPRTATAAVDAPSGAPNIFLAALRRWPMLLLGLLIGLAGGFLVYSIQPPKYQSTAQIAVYKKASNSAADARLGIFEDYISAQIDTIRSPKILGTASKSASMNTLSRPLSDDRAKAAEALRLSLTVTRSRDTGAGGVAVSPIINLAFTGLDPMDTKTSLDAIITTYVEELSARFTSETRDKLKGMNENIRKFSEQRNQMLVRKDKLTAEKDQITAETQNVLSARISGNRDQQLKLENEIDQLQTTLKMIDGAGKNREDRLRLLGVLGIQRNLDAEFSPQSPEVQIQLQEVQRESLMQSGLGKDHEKIRALDGQIALLKALVKKRNPDQGVGDNDLLAAAELNFRFKLENAKRNKIRVEAQLAEDTTTFKNSSKIFNDIENARVSIENSDREIAKLQGEITRIESTETIGGFNTDRLAEPQVGGKVAPVLTQWLALGGVFGIFLGFGLSLLVELSDKSFRSPAEIRNRLGVPVIGHIPAIRLDLPSEADVPAEYSDTLVSARRPKSIEAESYRGVRTQLSVITANSGHQVIQVTSPNPGDGKSTLAANLAISLAQSGKRTVLLDCDFRKPRVHKLFAITKPELGLASVTGGLANLSQAIRHSSIDNLDILPCGPRPQNPAELLSGPRFQQVLSELRQMYDYVIVDTPPMLAVSDPRVVAQRVDGILLVFKITKRARPLAERAREQLADMGANLLGVIVNGGGNRSGDQYGYSYGYNYAYSYEYEYAETYVDVDEPLDPNGSGKIVL